MKHFLLRFCSFELTRVSTYRNISNEFRSERSCFAFSLPKSEARTRKWASRTASLARDTIRKRRNMLIHRHFPKTSNCTYSPFPIGPKEKKKSQTHSSLCKNRFPCSAHLKSQLSLLHCSCFRELNKNLFINCSLTKTSVISNTSCSLGLQ